MDAQRVKQLESFIREDPSDPFPKYALALEYMEAMPEKTSLLFDELLEHHEGYTATYYHAADFFFRLNKIEKAREIYLKGIELIGKSGDLKALHELQNAFQNFQFEVDY